MNKQLSKIQLFKVMHYLQTEATDCLESVQGFPSNAVTGNRVGFGEGLQLAVDSILDLFPVEWREEFDEEQLNKKG